MLENNLNPNDFLHPLYEKDKLSYNDYWHLREWYYIRPHIVSDEEAELIAKQVLANIYSD